VNPSEEKVQIWQGDLDRWFPLLPQWKNLLSPDEHERAERYYFEKDRRHFAASRSLLRILLGKMLKQDPAAFLFHYTEYGRPFLKEGAHPHPLEFNLSHSHGRFLLAAAWRRRVGVDLEFIRSDLSFDSISCRYFASEESEAVVNAPKERKPALFFRYWTLKEAFIKAQGKGLSYPLNRFSVQWRSGETRASLSVPSHPHEATRWSLRFLKPPTSFIAALALEGELPELELHSLEELKELLKLER
jgi:4'-phosphopantetheinyl transferase